MEVRTASVLTLRVLRRRPVGGGCARGEESQTSGSFVAPEPTVVLGLPEPSKVGSKIVALAQFRELSEDDREGQFEGQNGARVCLSEPVSACVG